MLAQVAGDPTGITTGLIGGAGVAGVWVLTLIMGKMHTDSAMQALRDTVAYERLRADELAKTMMTEVIPALNNAAAAMKAQAQRTRRAGT